MKRIIRSYFSENSEIPESRPGRLIPIHDTIPKKAFPIQNALVATEIEAQHRRRRRRRRRRCRRRSPGSSQHSCLLSSSSSSSSWSWTSSSSSPPTSGRRRFLFLCTISSTAAAIYDVGFCKCRRRTPSAASSSTISVGNLLYCLERRRRRRRPHLRTSSPFSSCPSWTTIHLVPGGGVGFPPPLLCPPATSRCGFAVVNNNHCRRTTVFLRLSGSGC